MQLADLKINAERRRKWTGFVVALTVTFSICEAQQIDLSSSERSLSSMAGYIIVQSILPEQKAPPVLTSLQNTGQTNASRKYGSHLLRAFDGANCFRYALVMPAAWLDKISAPASSSQKTRDPPFMVPSLFR